jgi:6,7-dimethyl-8-ribityllumazine synthase
VSRILIVEARFYPHISDALYDGAARALDIAGVVPDRMEVAGALEIPTAIKLAADGYDGFVALGCVIRGETRHFEIVAGESARGLMDLGIHYGLCIGNGILTVDTESQALRRARPEELDKGGDAARACLTLIRARDRIAIERLAASE